MKHITNISEIKRKTIERVSFVDCDEILVIVFADDTYAVFEAEHGYDGDCNIVLSTDELRAYTKLEAGFISQEEYDLVQKEEQQENKKENEVRERRQLEHLKKKYEGGEG